eukprot:9164001-Pyramimonas_sp.AAC.1
MAVSAQRNSILDADDTRPQRSAEEKALDITAEERWQSCLLGVSLARLPNIAASSWGSGKTT